MVRRLRKTKKNQRYDYNRNRKRLSNKDRKNGTIKCDEIRAAYDHKKRAAQNIRDMGLVYDVNRAIPMPNRKRDMVQMEKEMAGMKVFAGKRTAPHAPKKHVAEQLEQDANEFAGTRFRMARSMVRFITGMIDRHGFNYAAMVRDRRNYEQFTWRQYRSKIRRFLRIPEQCTPYLEEKGWLDCDMSDQSDPRWKDYSTEDEM
uniref:Nucleolar protein 16 n=1 Tax=Anopheles dirus TaxID=7168 RepID=A0A182NL28_9DIPT